MGQLFLREIKLIAGNHSLLLTLLLAPLFYVFFYGTIYSYKVEEKVVLAVADDDRSEMSRMFVEQMNNMQVVSVLRASSLEAAQERMYRGEAQGYFYIPKGMQSKVLSLQQADVVLAVNGARFLPSSELTGAITQLGLTIGAGVRLQYQEKMGLNSAMALQEAMPVNIDYRPLYNPQASYGGFLLPVLLVLILQQTLLLGLSGSVALERENGEIGRLVKVGGGLSGMLYGKAAFYLLLYLAYAAFFMTVNYQVLQLPFRGSYRDLAVLLFLFVATLIPMAVWIGTLFKSQLLAAQLMAFSTYPFFLICGYAWPFESMPPLLQGLSSLLPLTPFVKVYTSIVQTGGTLQDHAGSVIHLLLLWMFYLLMALWGLKRLNKKQQPISL
ncbi:ABC-2 type transport system permease protein [Chitinophaga eiseniae]|uniref:ABC-2 type transport system permease protein n=2 Tax=Chitinophaga eiseniae TaxID=634771 RepID=A0A1T4TS77_9BACT|nr:ABC-2 type transport system permease protein [Chitinophaga eiseniae]